ncbi:MAG: glutamate-5-semialdehyde dehydrogenase, partial [Frankiaceae bacterium]|nr:glutamate-5-semialdehyde dehydrogenase [Frankiaceae bacterium]
MTTDDSASAVLDTARRARTAAADLAPQPRSAKDAALLAMADALEAHTDEILAANALDVAGGRAEGLSDSMIDRLSLSAARVTDMADGLRQVATLPDPVGEIIRGYTLPNGLDVRQLRVPLGVIGIIYEARPNVTVDAAGLCVKSGNAVLLRGSSSARHSNEALAAILDAAATAAGLPPHTIQLVPGHTRESVKHLMTARGLVDVLIPRGGAGLIETVVRESTVPVIETGVGNCHVYVDAAHPSIESVTAIVLNAKVQRPSVCNAAETLLVHADAAQAVLPAVLTALRDAGVTVHADQRAAEIASVNGVPSLPVTDDDWASEYLSLDMAVGVVDSLDGAVAHIRRWSS